MALHKRSPYLRQVESRVENGWDTGAVICEDETFYSTVSR